MKSVEARGKTREEAIQGALRQLGVELYEVDKIEILDEGSRGFLGFGARNAHVRLTCQHLHDTPARAESGGDRDRGRRGGRGRDSRGGEQQPRGQGGQGQERRDGRQSGGQQSRDGQARDGQARDGQSRDGQSRDGQSRDGQSRDGQSRGRGGNEQSRGGNDANRGRGRDNRSGGGQQGGGNARPQQQRRAEAPAAPARENGPSEDGGTKHTSVHDEALDALRRAEMFEQALAGGADTMDAAADDRAPLPPAQAEEPLDPITDEQGTEAAELLRAMLDKMGLPGEVAFVRSDDGTPRLDVKSEHTPMLIGRKGHTLNALQYLVNRMLTKGDTAENTERLVVDIEGYVDRRRQSLEDLARTMASRAKESGRIVRLKPLSPQERRIIHMTLRGDDGVTTASHGDSLYRVVSITPVGGASPRPARDQRGGGGNRSGNGGSRRRRGGGGQRSGERRPQEQDPGTLGD